MTAVTVFQNTISYKMFRTTTKNAHKEKKICKMGKMERSKR